MSDPRDTEGDRAVTLFVRLNEKYFEFIRELPSPLARLGQVAGTYVGSADMEPFLDLEGLNPVLVGTPWLFLETFSELEDERFVLIAEAGACFVLASIVLDHLVDGHFEQPEPIILFQQALYANGAAKFRDAFPSSSSFWFHFDRLVAAHVAGIAAELDAQANPAGFSMERLLTITHGKVSPVVTTVAALAIASDKPEILEPIELSLKHISVASQLLDDLGDWRHDVQVGHMTYYLSCLAPPTVLMSKSLPSTDALESHINRNWTDIEHLRLIIEWLDRSIEAVQDIDCPRWVGYVTGYRTLAHRHLLIMTSQHLMRVLRP
ncbi:MAG: hypothetical protein M3220_09255, partial [Chloroflexota bacterium]|nr:hypothetical protein [Chloroflexota bacterium]